MTTRDFEVDAATRDRYPLQFAEHVRNGEFFCPWQTNGKPAVTDLLRWQLGTNPYRNAKKQETPIPADPDGLSRFVESKSDARVLWLGHATFLIELDGFRCLVDPVYGTVGRFVTRFSAEPFPFAALPPIDAVLLTHGHYDHLDVESLDAVARAHPDAQVYAPLGQGRYVPGSAGDVIELDWWQYVEMGGIEAVFVPMQHWHRRGMFDHNKALWGGWVLRGSQTVLHSGDSGYFGGFETLGEVFDIDIALLPVGAFEPRWFMKSQHMNPEEALRAFGDLGAREFVAMHWGTYDLTDEPLNLGAEEIRRLADESGVSNRVHTPPPGGFVGF